MYRPRSSKARGSLGWPVNLLVLLCLLLFFADLAGASTQVILLQTPGLQTTPNVTVPGQERRRIGPFRPPSKLPTRQPGDESPRPDNPPKVNPPPLVQRLYVTVPNLVGRPIDDALRLIRDVHLRSGRIHEEESTEPVDRVIQQSLKPETRVLIGTPIDLVVAQPRKTTVPRLIGRQRNEALRAISAAELKLGSIGEKESSEPTDQVIGQSLRPGSRV